MLRSLLSLAALLTTALAVNPIEIVDKKFYDSVTHKQFYIIGVDYQPGGSSGVGTGSDPLSDPTQCLRDFALLQKLGVNTIRVYSVDNTLNHDYCMSLLDTAGMYLLLDVNTPLSSQSLNRYEPNTTWTADYYFHIYSTIDAFKAYENVLGFFSGNEVVNDVTSLAACPGYLRALQRDMKAYIKKTANRTIPVGYSTADDATIRSELGKYLTCGDDASAADFYGINTYEWCGDSSFTSSGYSTLTSAFENFSVPVFFSEYGCNTVSPRTFTEVAALYGDQMNGVFSGGLIYEYNEEDNNYGLVNTDGDSAQLLQDYVNLQSAYANLSIPNVTLSSTIATATTTLPSCSGLNLDNWTIPAVPSGAPTAGADNYGTLIELTAEELVVNSTVTDVSGNVISGLSVTPVGRAVSGSVSGTSSASASATGGEGKSGNGTTSVSGAVGMGVGVSLGMAVLAAVGAVVVIV
ncbi:Glycolipid anchored surface protein 4 precursor [Saitoella coloradoensis]